MALVVIGLVRMIHVDEKKPHEANLMGLCRICEDLKKPGA
jgi:hypothetical protein